MTAATPPPEPAAPKEEEDAEDPVAKLKGEIVEALRDDDLIEKDIRSLLNGLRSRPVM